MNQTITPPTDFTDIEANTKEFLRNHLKTIELMLSRMATKMSDDDDVNDPKTKSFYRLYSSTVRLYMSVYKLAESKSADSAQPLDSQEIIQKSNKKKHKKDKTVKQPNSLNEYKQPATEKKSALRIDFENGKAQNPEINTNGKIFPNWPQNTAIQDPIFAQTG